RTPALARCDTISPRDAFLPPTCGSSAIPTSSNQRMFFISGPLSLRSRTQIHGPHDDRRHFFDAFRRRIEEGDSVAPVQVFCATQLDRALLKAGVPGIGSTLVTHLAETQRRRCQAETAPGELRDRARETFDRKVVIGKRVVRD